jgi:AraC-like DNA-binding protein
MTATPDLPARTPNLDLLSDVLRQVHIAGGVFIRGEFTAPWAYLSTDRATLTASIRPRAEYLMLFHLILEGTPSIRLETGESAELQPGDAVVFPFSDVHVMAEPWVAAPAPVPIERLLPPQPWHEMPVVRIAGGGAPTKILCGYLECTELLANPLLASLPRLVHVRPESESAAHWRLASWSYAIDQCSRGDGSFIGALPEAVLADCLRQFIAQLPEPSRGWLAALHDPVLTKALIQLHARPAHAWTVNDLAREVAASRTVLADRFTRTLGVSPMRYLARWRLQRASELLRTSDATVASIASRVGYEAESAFSRAFKRQVGLSPADWRLRHRAGSG